MRLRVRVSQQLLLLGLLVLCAAAVCVSAKRLPAQGYSVEDIPPICETTQSPSPGDHIHLAPCSPPSKAQRFVFDNKTGVFSLRADRQLCVTVGAEKDPDSGTYSVDLDECIPGNASQIFRYNTTTSQIIYNLTNQCIDLDADDQRIELYDCNVPVSPNQVWYLNSTSAITSGSDVQHCLTACTGIEPGVVGSVFNYTYNATDIFITTTTGAVVLVTFYAPDVMRYQMGPLGYLDDPVRNEIVSSTRFDRSDQLKLIVTVTDAMLEAATSDLVLQISRDPILLTLSQSPALGGQILLQEIVPLQWNTSSTFQTLQAGETEHPFGGGMQNGYFSQFNRSVPIMEGGGWAAGGRANPAPFYLTTAGYGCLRNTYAPGQYDFFETSILRHDEARFDGFYFSGPAFTRVIDLYTQATGRPFLPPIWGLHLGDSDCYNQKNRSTTDVLAVAVNYSVYDMPGGWMIPDDGYGCGYTNLPYVVEQLHNLGKYMALWTSTGLDNATWEIGTAGSRGIKTDVGWVGAGYKFELDAVKLATALIEDNSNARRYIWTVCGWAGTHAYAVMWNGDNTGGYEYLRFQIPTVLGSSMSGQAYTSGDVDGIFGGSNETYVRDLQWKCFLPVLMSMSGWAQYNKQPFVRGEPWTSINRFYLKLKVRLTPYQYTLAHLAHTTGLPPVRPMVLDYQNDPLTWENVTQYQFMSGPAILVAPVYMANETRDGIYLPGDTWIDYWNGTRYQGPALLNNYSAPLQTLPVLVRAGSIVPMWPAMNYFNELPHDPITLDVYPHDTQAMNSSFELYEDDGLTREFMHGAYSLQRMEMNATVHSVRLEVGAVRGNYTGIPVQRGYMVTMHTASAATVVRLNGATLQQYPSLDALNNVSSGWYFDPNTTAGLLTIKCGVFPLHKAFVLVVSR